MEINDIPYKVVIKFLEEYYSEELSDDNYHDVLLDLILSGEIESAPNEIVNWMIAYNNRNNKNIKTYKMYDILFDRIDIFELYQIFNVYTKEDVLQILSYLHKLDDDLYIFNNLPPEILERILLDLDVDSLLLLFEINKSTYLYSDDMLDNIIKSKILPYLDLYPDLDIKSLNNKQLIILTRIIEKGKYYGTIINDEFRIINRKEQLDLCRKCSDRRLSPLGKKCNNYNNYDLLEILWDVDGTLPENSYILKEKDRKYIIDELSGREGILTTDRHVSFKHRNYNYDDTKNWDLQKLTFFYNWFRLRPRPTNKFLCDIIRSRMEELGMIKYL